VLLRRPTAVKLLHPEKNSAKDLARFEREVQLTSRLTHPNTIAIYDYGHTPDGLFYYAMEYIEGTTLKALVERTGPLCAARAIYLLRQISASLAEAHGAGLIHRDIKPANVMVCARGGIYDLVKVLDFGLVKDVGSSDAVAVTAVGVIAGTPNYMAPEAVRSDGAVDARTDIYAIGVTGYFLVTGTELFKGASAAELLAQHLSQEPERPSARLGRPVAEDFEDVILACLAKDPNARPQTAEELITRLSACQDSGQWTRDAARTWWESDGQACAVGKADESSRGTLHSMFIDVGTRSEVEPPVTNH
jgi:serine/threonine protein kinase